jgi:DNA primase
VLVRTVALPGGQDPDDVVREGGAEPFRKLAAERQDVVDFFYTRSKGDPKPAAIDRLARLVALVPDEIPRRELSAKAADWFKFDEETFVRAVEGMRSGRQVARPSTGVARTHGGAAIHGLEGELLRVAVQDPAFWTEVSTLAERESLRRMLERRIRPSVREFLRGLADQDAARPASAYRDDVDDPVLREFLMELATEGVVDQEHLRRTQRDLISRLFYLALKDERDRLRRELNQAEQSGDEEREREISRRYKETVLRLSALEQDERAQTP